MAKKTPNKFINKKNAHKALKTVHTWNKRAFKGFRKILKGRMKFVGIGMAIPITFALIMGSMLWYQMYMMTSMANAAMTLLMEEEEKELAENQEDLPNWYDDITFPTRPGGGSGGNGGNGGNGGSGGTELPPGVYPSDPDLAMKAQMLELAKEIADDLDLDPRMPFWIGQIESGNTYNYTSSTPNVYTDLITSNGKDSWFKDGNVNIGPVEYQGHDKAIGSFQYETKYIDDELCRMYNATAMGVPSVHDVGGHMKVMDDDLGFNRPHPLFMPDAMYNVLYKYRQKMDSHVKYAEADSRWSSTPKEVQDQILFMYAGDAYRGDMHAQDGRNALDMHNAMVSLYLDVYEHYGKITGFDTTSSTHSRMWVMGTQRSGNAWDGTLDSPITIDGVSKSQTLLEEMKAKTQTGHDYMAHFNKIKHDSVRMYKLGVAYGFQGMNEGTKFYDKWYAEVKQGLVDDGNWNPGGGSGGSGSGGSGTGLTPEAQQELRDLALKQVGKPYVRGTAGPDTFDCSGLIQWLYKEMNVSFKWPSIDGANGRAACMAHICTPIEFEDLQIGDLIFRHDGSTDDLKNIGHVLVYVGNGEVVHASSPKTGVKKGTIDYYANSGTHRAMRPNSLVSTGGGNGGNGGNGGGTPGDSLTPGSEPPAAAKSPDTDLSKLYPKPRELAQALVSACAEERIPIRVTEGYRSIDRQEYLYAQGRSEHPWYHAGDVVTNASGVDRKSMHQWGLAFDICINISGSAYNKALLNKAGKIGEGLGLEWGGSWTSFVDRPHYQYDYGLSISDLKAGKRPNDTAPPQMK